MRFRWPAHGLLLLLALSGCLKPIVKSSPSVAPLPDTRVVVAIPPADTTPPPALPIPAPAAPVMAPDTLAITPAPALPRPLDCRVTRNSVRVLLSQSKSPVPVTFSNGFVFYHNNTKEGFASDKAVAEYKGGILSFAGRRMPLTSGMAVTLVPVDRSAAFSVNGNRYRGSLTLRPAKSGALSIINEIFVEDYLRGVLPYEIGIRDSNLFEALKVQAIVARTYTYSRLNSHADEGYDVYSDQSDQVYNGMKGEYRLSDQAVESTRDEVVTFNDSLIQSFYYSTSCGSTANIEDVWPDRGYRPYLRSIPDAPFNAGAKYATWTERWPGPALSAIGNKGLGESIAGFEKGTLTDITVQDTFACGRVRTLAVTVSGKVYTVSGDRTRWILRRNQPDRPILQSACFRLTAVKNADNTIRELTAEGRGFGHGVGLSQVGAIGMARAGKNDREIIGAYYTGVRLARVVY
ncbi:MAG: SpoIID/LytB domain-containing protein [Fibrobacterota bacterium]